MARNVMFALLLFNYIELNFQPCYRYGSFIFELVLGIFWGPLWLIVADAGSSGPQPSIPDDLTDLGTQHGSSGARVRPYFGHVR